MNRLLSTLLLCALLLPPARAEDLPPPLPLPQEIAPPPRHPPLRLRELRLKEAVARGEISEEEARRLRQFYRHHEAMRLQLRPPPRRSASQPAGDAPPDWQRWRQRQDRWRVPPDNTP